MLGPNKLLDNLLVNTQTCSFEPLFRCLDCRHINLRRNQCEHLLLVFYVPMQNTITLKAPHTTDTAHVTHVTIIICDYVTIQAVLALD